MTDLQQKCLDLAEEICNEINGDMFYVPQEDVERLLSSVTEDNLSDVSSELAELAHWFN
jgi:hypothetical protein